MQRFGHVALLVILAAALESTGIAQPVHGIRLLEQSGRRIRVLVQPELSPLLAKTALPAVGQALALPPNFLSHTFLLIAPPDGGIAVQPIQVERRPLGTLPENLLQAIPRQVARVAGSGWWRGFRLVRIEVAPVVNAGAGLVDAVERVELAVDFSPERKARVFESPVSLWDGRPRDPDVQRSANSTPLRPEEHRILRLALNGSAGLQFRAVRPEPLADTTVSTQPQRPYWRLRVRETGIYRLTYEQLAQSARAAARVDPHALQLLYRGQPQPVLFQGDADEEFEPGEAILFYGERLRGKNGDYFDDETADNVYQLVPGTAQSLRFQTREVRFDSHDRMAAHFAERAHFEVDSIYYFGDNDADLFTTARIPGEGWIWTTLVGGRRFIRTLELPGAQTRAPACSLIARIRGITRDGMKPNHHAQITLNGHVLADTLFADNADIILRAAFPSEFLTGRQNELEVISVGDTRAAIDQIYLDWVELQFWRAYVVEQNELHFRPPPGSPSTVIGYKLQGFSEEEVMLFDVGTGAVLQGAEIAAAGDSSFQVSFSDTLRAASQYIAVAPGAFREPVDIDWVQPVDWDGTQHQADMIVITHGNFREQAERLASYRRQRNGFRVAVIDVQEIFDAFNFGIYSAAALRRFLEHAYWRWQPPAPLYVILLGDASWDPKRNAPTSSKESFVPAFGNPVSDNRLVCVDGPDDFLPDMLIGRLAVETPEQAAAVVDKVIAYEGQPLQAWSKDFLFLTGGISSFEQRLFQAQSEKLIGQFVEVPPVAGRATRLYKKSEGRLPGELLPEILQALAAGTAVVAFAGHAGSQTWELMMVNQDIPRVQNQNRLPFIASMTCHTARFAEPGHNSFGEDFLRLPQRGAVGFWGTSGWGFIFQDGVLLEGLFRALASDTIRDAGSALVRAKLELWQRYGGFDTNINLIDQYTLLGDPALRLNLPERPDLTLPADGIMPVPARPTERDTLVTLKVRIRNRGLATTDSTQMLIQITPPEPDAGTEDLLAPVGRIGFADTLLVAWPGQGRRGTYRLQAEIDFGQRIDEEDESNNQMQAVLTFLSTQFSQAFPRPMEIVPEVQPLLSIYSPASGEAPGSRYFFEIDSTANFDSPLLQSSNPVEAMPMRTSWRVPRPLPAGRFFWRVRRQEQDEPESAWQASSFILDPSAAGGGFLQSGADWAAGSGVYDWSDSGATLPQDGEQQRFRLHGEVYSPPIGPARKWLRLTIDTASVHMGMGGASGGERFEFELLGRERAGAAWRSLGGALSDPQSISLIDAARFPFLRLHARLFDDDGRDSPLLKSWRVDFEPLGDLVLSPALTRLEQDLLLPGAWFTLHTAVAFFGQNPPDSTEVALIRVDPVAGRSPVVAQQVVLADGVIRELAFRWPAEKVGEEELLLHIDPEDTYPEPYESNNLTMLRVHVVEDRTPPQLLVTFDGRELFERGAYVGSRPEIICRIFDDNAAAIHDTSHVSIFVDGRRLPFVELQFDLFESGAERARVTFSPELEPGEHEIAFLVVDAFGNRAARSFSIRVASSLALRDVFNYPNPFAEKTTFTFVLTQPADLVQVKIYTVGGRLIQVIEKSDVVAGFQQLAWDGRDRDGDVVANGIYLYKIIARQGSRSVEILQKLGVAR